MGRDGICWFAKQAEQASPRGAKKPVPYIAMPVYVGNKISAQTKNRDEKLPLFVFYKAFVKPITKASFAYFSSRSVNEKEAEYQIF